MGVGVLRAEVGKHEAEAERKPNLVSEFQSVIIRKAKQRILEGVQDRQMQSIAKCAEEEVRRACAHAGAAGGAKAGAGVPACDWESRGSERACGV